MNLKTFVLKELEGKESYIREGQVDIPFYYKIKDLLKALSKADKNFVSKEYIEKVIEEFYQARAGDSTWHIPLRELKDKLINEVK